jgi:AcrR family transcriptional regulator
LKTTTKPSQGRPRGRPRNDESPASLEVIFEAALQAFATHGYDGVSLRTLNRELGGSHNLLSGRFGSKEALWYATVDWAFEPLVLRLATAFDPTVSDPVEQLRITMRAFLLYSAQRPELLGLMSIEGRQDTDRLSYVYNTYVHPALEPVERLLDHLADIGRIRRIPLRTFFFLLTHGAAAPFTLAPLARHFDTADPLAPARVESHADLAADLIIRALEIDSAAHGGDQGSANGKRRRG